MDRNELLQLDDQQLMALCDMHIYKASGPGGQHRNKVSSAIRLKHRETGISATANDSRSQNDNKKLAVTRLRMNLATKIRQDIAEHELPQFLAECIFTPKKSAGDVKKLDIGRKDWRFWLIGGYLLDMLDLYQGKIGDVARELNVTTGNLTTIFKKDRHLLAQVQEIRRKYQLKPIK